LFFTRITLQGALSIHSYFLLFSFLIFLFFILIEILFEPFTAVVSCALCIYEGCRHTHLKSMKGFFGD
jgi:hypothetical protein